MNARPAGLLLALVVGLLVPGSRVLADPPARQRPAVGPARDMDPNVIGTRYAQSEAEIVPPEQREALGLDDAAWTKQYGKVHPDVYVALEKAEKVKEPWRNLAGLAGAVYVQVQLRRESTGNAASAGTTGAIGRLEGGVLSRLTAAEFHVEYAFQTTPCILGYARRSALEKLRAVADVAAICLDEKPFVSRPAHVVKEDLPPPKAGDPATQPARGRFWGSGGKVEADVYRALAKHGRVFVVVNVSDPGKAPPLSPERFAEVRGVEDGVLCALTANDLWVTDTTLSFPSIAGYVNTDGLNKLVAQDTVTGIGLDGRGFPSSP